MKNSVLQMWAVFLLIWLSMTKGNTFAQVRIGPGTGAIDGSVTLEIKSGPYSSGNPYRGLLVPTLTANQRNQIQNPATGLLIFNTNTKQIEVNTGTTTSPIWTPGGITGTSSSSSGAWSLTGNAGTVSNTNFLGTTDNVSLWFRVNNQNAGRIDPTLFNVGLGYSALSTSTTGQGNTASGAYTLYYNTTGGYNTASGFQALHNNSSGSGNTASGTIALLANTVGNDNAAFGSTALQNNTTGSTNAGFGAGALKQNTTGNYNTASGAGALQNNTSANGNSALGHNALATNTTGYANIGVGEDALSANVDGHDNVALGTASMTSNTNGIGNVASGNLALRLNTTGQNNTASGLLSLQYNTIGSYNTALGYNAGPLVANGGLTNTTAIGANAIVSASNQIVLGDNNITALRCNVQTITSLSDVRIKENIRDNVPGLSFITKLTPITYNIDKAKEARLLGYPLATVKEDKILHSGFAAQDVEAAAKEIGYDFEGVSQQADGQYYTLGYTLFVIPLVQSVKELNTEVENLKAKLKATTAAYDQLSAQVKQMQHLLGLAKTKN
ncbi:hypothetical protein G8759_33980 [Spirosoma aureum]|uniref:Peptidase S74 domain-containing protein n=1 Tax=Spirosoma aureum TaxID=2692134 RepID=A0A6G9AY70_9BACT|nr:tail fiber domain-containing protein [Spirosoma aureum]QIP17298.1 hypothetical protein G8759_33980 [Spirosoma aureum]